MSALTTHNRFATFERKYPHIRRQAAGAPGVLQFTKFTAGNPHVSTRAKTGYFHNLGGADLVDGDGKRY